MSVRAKFQCLSITRVTHQGGVGNTVALQPVYSGDKNSENGKFFSATPAGKIEMSGLSEDVLNQFTPGQEYYLDFTPAY